MNWLISAEPPEAAQEGVGTTNHFFMCSSKVITQRPQWGTLSQWAEGLSLTSLSIRSHGGASQGQLDRLVYGRLVAGLSKRKTQREVSSVPLSIQQATWWQRMNSMHTNNQGRILNTHIYIYEKTWKRQRVSILFGSKSTRTHTQTHRRPCFPALALHSWNII